MRIKKRKYDESYLQYGFTSIVVNYEERPQCVLCSKVRTKLKQHLHNVHPHSKDKEKFYFERQSRALKKMRLDASRKIVEAPYVVAFEIAKQKMPHSIGETLIKPCVLNWLI